MNQETVVVVGGGMVGHRLCARLRELDTARRFRIVLIGEETRAPYDRVNLSHYYDTHDAEELALAVYAGRRAPAAALTRSPWTMPKPSRSWRTSPWSRRHNVRGRRSSPTGSTGILK